MTILKFIALGHMNFILMLSLLVYLSLFTAEIAGSSSAVGHDEVTASAREDLCIPMASSWPKCRYLVGGKFIPAPLAGRAALAANSWSGMEFEIADRCIVVFATGGSSRIVFRNLSRLFLNVMTEHAVRFRTPLGRQLNSFGPL